MNVWRLVLREISHRKLNFAMGLLSASVAVACLVGAFTLLEADDIRTRQILDEKRKAVEKAGAELQDAMRKISLGLGFNILILPSEQDLQELHVKGTLSKSMPEEYVTRLSSSRIVTVNHLLPTVVQQKIWTRAETGAEEDLPIVVMGTRGEVPIMHADPKKPLLDMVAPGTMVVGFQVHQKLKLSQGDEVTLMGRKFTVATLHPERGTVDDGTLWINLAEAQAMLGMQNLINAIWALECHCVGDRISQIRAEIAGILPGTQVIERGPPALARAEARDQARQAAEMAMQNEQQSRARFSAQREGFAAVLVPLVMVGCAAWIGLLSFGNVRQRNAEIGILRAIGLRSVQILLIFLGKAWLIGFVGAVVGYVAGFAVALFYSELPRASETALQLFVPGLLAAAVITAPLLAAVASWIPAMLAARQDPAVVLQGE